MIEYMLLKEAHTVISAGFGGNDRYTIILGYKDYCYHPVAGAQCTDSFDNIVEHKLSGINHRPFIEPMVDWPPEKPHSLLRSILQEPTSSVSSSPHASPPNPLRSSIGLETIGVDGRHRSYPAEEERLESHLPSHPNTPNSGKKDRWYTNTRTVNPVVGYPDSGFIDSLERLPQLESESPEFQNKFPSNSYEATKMIMPP
ncbi:hypothetical protein C8R41DRAFT_870617 [Lentinula lateritia]|uniref:Uncharacterized protein n=1 Tax=Lentinula lateritia TaxID=40482 RepID=A0ABQ8V8T4_9AGAR|nr:hypothetical protein C8R41DRAFT_870617 [Lentinula lateritia]